MAKYSELGFFIILLFQCINFTTSFHLKTLDNPFFLQSLPDSFFGGKDFDLASGPVPGPFPPPAITPPPPDIAPSPPTPGASPPKNDDPSQNKSSSGGLSGGQKAGIVIGTLAGAGLLVFGGMIYKKRRSNIRRARHGSAARTVRLGL